MPLENAPVGSAGFSRNVATEVKSGRPVREAVAIAYSKAGERRDADPQGVHRYMNHVAHGDSAAMARHDFGNPK